MISPVSYQKGKSIQLNQNLAGGLQPSSGGYQITSPSNRGGPVVASHNLGGMMPQNYDNGYNNQGPSGPAHSGISSYR